MLPCTYNTGAMKTDTAFEMAVSSIRFGAGVTREVGMDLADLGIRSALVITDPTLRGMRPFQTVIEALDAEGIACTVYDRVRVEPNDESFLDAIGIQRIAEQPRGLGIRPSWRMEQPDQGSCGIEGDNAYHEKR